MFKKIEKELKTKENILSIIETNEKQEEETILQKKRRKDEKKKKENQISQVNIKETNEKAKTTSESEEEDEEEDEIEKVKRQIKMEKKGEEGEEGEDKEYKGRNYYKRHINKSEIDMNNHKYLGNLGPMKANTTIKASSQIDYSRGICKDYKVSGVCGYGDGCIFLHDRTEYKSSYEIDIELKRKEILKKKREIEGLSFALSSNNNKDSIVNMEDNENKKEVCRICSKRYINPVETICKHVFCEGCALRNYSKSKKCFVCNKDVNGIFNSIDDVTKRKYIV